VLCKANIYKAGKYVHYFTLVETAGTLAGLPILSCQVILRSTYTRSSLSNQSREHSFPWIQKSS
jgi:hypothetical protein